MSKVVGASPIMTNLNQPDSDNFVLISKKRLTMVFYINKMQMTCKFSIKTNI